MAEIVERLIELISDASPIEEKVSGLVAGMIEKTATRLARFETVPDEAGSPIDNGGPQAS